MTQWFGPRMAGWRRKEKAPRREEGRWQREAKTERRGKREESGDKREYIMNRAGDSTHGIEASQDHDDKEKREERREKREERRAKREERGEKREERRKKREETPNGPQMRPHEVPKEVPRGLWAGGMAQKRVGP